MHAYKKKDVFSLSGLRRQMPGFCFVAANVGRGKNRLCTVLGVNYHSGSSLHHNSTPGKELDQDLHFLI